MQECFPQSPFCHSLWHWKRIFLKISWELHKWGTGYIRNQNGVMHVIDQVWGILKQDLLTVSYSKEVMWATNPIHRSSPLHFQKATCQRQNLFAPLQHTFSQGSASKPVFCNSSTLPGTSTNPRETGPCAHCQSGTFLPHWTGTADSNTSEMSKALFLEKEYSHASNVHMHVHLLDPLRPHACLSPTS